MAINDLNSKLSKEDFELFKASLDKQFESKADKTVATTSANGLMSSSDKTKLNGIAANANNYSHPTSSGNKHIPSGGSAGQILRWSSDGTAVWGADNNTTYSVATTSADGLMSSADKTKLNGIATNANNYSHPTSSGNKHIPSGGSAGQFLKWSADGTAVWANDNNTTYTAGTGLSLTGTTFSANIGTGSGQVAAGNHTHSNLEQQIQKTNSDLLSFTNDCYVNVLSYGIKEGLNVNVQENTANFQRMINECRDTKVICFPSGDFVFNEVDLGVEGNISIKGVSNPFGSFANKNIYTGAIKNTLTRIICNASPGKTFFKHKSCILLLEDISFYNLKKDAQGRFTEEEAKTNILMQHTRSEGAKKNIEKGKVFATNCGFFGWKVVFGSEFTFQHLEDEWGTGLVESNFEYFKQSCVVANRCRFTRNGIGVNQSVDGRLVDCSFNKNDYAIVFRENSGYSTIESCRVEWNIYNGIYVYRTHDLTVSNVEYDCNGYAGLYCVENTNCNFLGGVYRRNGAKVPTTDSSRSDYEKNVHFYIKNNIDCTFTTANTVSKPVSDVGSAPTRPSNCSYFGNNTNCIFSLNNLTGCTKKDKEDANRIENNTNCIIKDNVLTHADHIFPELEETE